MVRKILRGFLAFWDASEVASDERLAEGWPRALAYLFVLLMPAMLAGPIRYVTGVSLNFGLVLGLALVAVAVWPFRKCLWERPSGVVYAFPIALAVVSGWLLYNGDFAGLPTYQDQTGNVAIDAAVHVLDAHLFVTQQETYGGFVSLYSLWYAVRYFVHDFVLVANFTYQLGVLTIAFSPFMILFSLLRGRERNIGGAAALGAGLAISYFILLPLEGFHLLGGFLPHLFAVIPLLAIWWVDALVNDRALRLLLIAALGVLYRYTYGLNLADLIAAVGGLLVLEATAKELTRAGRVLMLVAALGAFVVCQHAWTLLVPMLTSTTGWIVPHDLDTVWRGQILVVIALAAAMGFARGPLVRALRFPALFGVSNALLMQAFKEQPGGARAWTTIWAYYYFNKYSLHAVVLLGCACVVAIGFWATRKRWVPAGITLLFMIAGLWQMQAGFAPYQAIFSQIAFGKAPYARLRPWVDVEIMKRMERTLRSEDKELGGFIGEYYPLAAFMNATFGHGKYPFWNQQPIEATAGHCIFWEGGKVPGADADPNRSCESYFSRYAGKDLSLCWRCF